MKEIYFQTNICKRKKNRKMDLINEINNKQKAKRTKDRHIKVGGRDRHITLPLSCASQLYQLTQELGFKTQGETVGWLMWTSTLRPKMMTHIMCQRL